VTGLIESASLYLQRTASTTLGYALRSLGASFNKLASERKEGLLKVQAADVKAALEDVRPGFESFFQEDVIPVLAQAAQTTQLRMAQVALARMTAQNRRPNQVGNYRHPQSQHRRGGGGGGSTRPRGDARTNTRESSAPYRRPQQQNQRGNRGRRPHHRGGSKKPAPHDRT
jgi:hypothetical protein